MTTIRRSALALAILGLLEDGPLHPYGMQQLIKRWRKDEVINAGQRATLYKVINRLSDAGLISPPARPGNTIPRTHQLRADRRGSRYASAMDGRGALDPSQ